MGASSCWTCRFCLKVVYPMPSISPFRGRQFHGTPRQAALASPHCPRISVDQPADYLVIGVPSAQGQSNQSSSFSEVTKHARYLPMNCFLVRQYFSLFVQAAPMMSSWRTNPANSGAGCSPHTNTWLFALVTRHSIAVLCSQNQLVRPEQWEPLEQWN